VAYDCKGTAFSNVITSWSNPRSLLKASVGIMGNILGGRFEHGERQGYGSTCTSECARRCKYKPQIAV
jgi:hypothetical protein